MKRIAERQAPTRRTGWIQAADGVAYPPEPWFLGGEFAVGVFLVPVSDLPPSVAEHLPVGARPLTLAGRAIVGVSGVHYTPGGVLAYDELLVAVPVWHRRRLRVSIPQIWVTSPASRTGGRELWGIPKLLMSAERRVRERRLDAAFHTESGALATVAATAAAPLPGTWVLPMPILQRLDGVVTLSRNTVRGALHLARSEWTFSGPLSWIGARRPVLSIAITRAAIVFGRDTVRG